MHANRVDVRPASRSDLDTLVRFNQAIALETEQRELDAHQVRAGVLHVLNDPARGVYFVAERGGNVVGQMFITREWSDWRDGEFWWIQSVYVLPSARRSGVYRALHEHVEQIARRNERICGLRLYVEAENYAAQQVYERMGMHATRYRLYEIDWKSPEKAGSGGLSGTGAVPPHGASAARAPAERAPAPIASGEAVAIDLYCLTCGYNLRGLAGDPVRCPECGNSNPRGDIELPAPVIRDQLRRMETGPALSVAMLLLIMIMAAVLLFAPPGVRGSFLPSFGVIGLMSMLGWAGAVRHFARSCLHQPGWAGTLARYQAAGAVGIAALILGIFGCSWMLTRLTGVRVGAAVPTVYYWGVLLLALVVAGLLRLTWRPLQRFAKGDMETLQRSVAVEVARRELRQRMLRRSPMRG